MIETIFMLSVVFLVAVILFSSFRDEENSSKEDMRKYREIVSKRRAERDGTDK